MLAGDKPLLHGGDLDAVKARFPSAPRPWIDLSTGINPFAYPVGDINHEVWARLPAQSAGDALVETAKRTYRVPDGFDVVAAPGTQAVIQVLPRLFSARKVAVVGPTYREHARCWALGGHEIIEVSDLSQALKQIPDVVVVVNPNNPTGWTYSGEQIADSARVLAQRNGHLVVDEAFCDFCAGEVSAVPLALENVVVLRSFGKTYGLAGLRLGFAIAAPRIARDLRESLGPWAVPGAAIEIGRRALDDSAWLADARSRTLEASHRLSQALRAAGFDIVGRTALFVLGSHRDAPSIQDKLAACGIHVRHFPDAPTRLRFGLPDSETSWQRLLRALGNET